MFSPILPGNGDTAGEQHRRIDFIPGTILVIAQQGKTTAGKLDTDLMGTAGMQTDTDKGSFAFPKLAAKFHMVAAIEKYHEERYRALLKNVETAQVFEKSEVKVWECRNCGHLVVGTKAPELCPTCAHPQSYFEVHAENY